MLESSPDGDVVVGEIAGASGTRLRHRMLSSSPYIASLVTLATLFILQSVGDPSNERHTNILLGAYLCLPLVYACYFLLRPRREAVWGSAATAAAAAILQVVLPPAVAVRNTSGGWVAALTLVSHGALILLYLSVPRLRSDVSEQEEVVAKAIALANTDALTGLPNRRGLEEAVSSAGAADAGLAPTLVLGFVDFDGFKAVNDGFGHLAGDELLRAIAQRLKANVRSGDLVARIGGDEMVIFVSAPVPDTRAYFERVLGALDQPFGLAGEQFVVGASIGVFEGSADLETALAMADAAMYRAKERGGGLEITVERKR